jgi:CubicO group peptidase (beta-lactamase class C family)
MDHGLPFAFLLPNRVRVYPPDEVERRNTAAEVDPREADLTRDDVEAIWDGAVRLYRTGVYPAVALCLRRRGRVVIDRCIGHRIGNAPRDRRDGPREVAHPDHLHCLFSASKAVASMLVHLLDERGLLRLDDPVAEYLPAFARHGKERITIRHVLTHRAGIPSIPGGVVDMDLLADPDRIAALLCDARPRYPAGRRLAYHAMTSGFLLGEVIRRVSGVDAGVFLRREIAEPLGLRDFAYGVRPGDDHRIVHNAFTGIPAVPPFSTLFVQALGVGVREAAELSNDPRFHRAVIPSGNLYATARDTARFFELLLCEGELDGVRVFDRRTVRRAVAEQSYFTFDSTIFLPLGYGMGFMLGHEWASLYGPDAVRAYGHIGFTNVLGYADPDRDIAVALLESGKPFIGPHLPFWFAVTRTIARRCRPVPRRTPR